MGKMAAQCVEEKCKKDAFGKPSCEEACAAKAKAGAKDNCKKDDKECLAKFKKMAAQCVEQKCKKNPSCEDACAAKAKAGAQKKCKKDDKECLNKFKQMAAKCVEAKCSGMMNYLY